MKLRLRVTLPVALAALLAAAPPAGAQSLPAPSLSLDTLFAPPTGIARTDFPPTGTAGTRHDGPAAVAVSGNRIYTVGVTGTSRASGDDRDIAIVAHLATGGLDTSFAEQGKLTLSVGAEADIGTGIAVLPDGRLRVIAASDRSGTTDTSFDAAVIGLRANGTPDPAFGTNVNGVQRVILMEETNNEVPARIVAAPDGRVAITGFRNDGTRDDAFLALLDQEGDPVTGPAGGFDARGVRFTPTASVDDRGVDVAFRPGGGLVMWTSVAPSAAPDEAVLRAFNGDGTTDLGFGTAGEVVVGNTDTVPGGLITRGGSVWVSGFTRVGADTDAFLARVDAANGAGLQVRRFDMRGRFLPTSQAVLSRSNDLVAVSGLTDTLVAVGSVNYSIDGATSSTDWAAAAFNGLDGDLAGAGIGDIVLQAPGNGELLSVSAGPEGGWVAVAGAHIESDDNFGTARLLLDAEKACDLAVAAAEPGEIVVKGSSPAALTVRVQNVGSRACAGTVGVASPYGMTPVATGVVVPGATFTAAAVPVTYQGPRRADDVLTITLDAPADVNPANNRALAHVVFSYCDLAVQAVGGAGAIPSEGRRRFELSLRNIGTATCRVRVGSKASYPLARGKPASDAVAVEAPAGARPGTRVPVVLRASATDDVDLRNNAVRVSPEVVRVGDSDLVSWGARRFAGTARRGVGDLSASRLRPARVDVAVLRKGGRRCSWLSSPSGGFDTVSRDRDGDCGRPRWLRADGVANWELTLRGRLASGSYVAFSRATIRAGFPEARFSAKDRNRIAFAVR